MGSQVEQETPKPKSPALVSEVAQRLLLRRLQGVYRYLPLAAWFSDFDDEFIHQLRVSCRRAETALQLFSDVLPKSARKRWRNRLRTLRRGASAAREIDVMRNGLLALPPADAEFGKALERELLRQRKRVQRRILEIAADEDLEQFQHDVRSTLDAVRWRGTGKEPTWARVSQTTCQRLLKNVAKAARQVPSAARRGSSSQDFDALHRLRLAGKKLRYALNLTRRGKGWQPSQQVALNLEEMQTRLGEINDHATCLGRLRRLQRAKKLVKWRAELIDWQQQEQRASQRKARAFLRWWKSPQHRLELP